MEKTKVILGVDPAFIKCGFGIIDLEGKYIDSYQR